MGRFDGKVIAITGGGAGIGRRYALRFAAEGARVAVLDRRADAAEAVVAALAADGHAPGLACALDVSDQAAVRAAAGRITETFGGVDVLVNNAAIHHDDAQLPFTPEAIPEWRRVLDVNVVGALICTLELRPAMTGRDAAVINHSSMAAYMGGSAYAVSKLALNALTVGLAEQLAPEGIRVNGIAPGLVDSESSVTWMGRHDGIEAQLVGRQLVGRLGRMDDLAEMAMFLASPAASFITGQTFLVDGGLVRKAW